MFDDGGLIDIEIRGSASLHQYEELVKIFLQPSQYRVHGPELSREERSCISLSYDVTLDEQKTKAEDRYVTARQIYEDLAQITGKKPKWGVLTGIRPVKLAGEICRMNRDDPSVTDRILRERYLAHPDKANLVTEILKYQTETAAEAPAGHLALYVGIPFCPTRCLYCSFTSNRAEDESMAAYVDALREEVAFAAKEMAKRNLRPESIYMGGGTPTALPDRLFDELLEDIKTSFDLSGLKEFTVEAGRPDTIDESKLEILNRHGTGKISINPQSMKQETLDLIGRKHSVEDTVRAFKMAREAGFGSINMDMIAGLPGEGVEDFSGSIDEILALGPDRITLHTLAVKRASRLKESDENFNYRDEEIREEMLSLAANRLRREGYKPYYLYRQKYTSGNTENTGWCRNDDVGIYNIRIMDEHQSILALGAGGISKRYFPEEDRLERIPNVSNYAIYIDRIRDMIERKRKNFFI